MTAPDTVKSLVQRFEQHRDAYRSGRYNETQLRREFLGPFFEALGWDIFNKQSYAEMYKDVIHEDSLEIEGENKAPDYAFRIGGTRRFFVEAKKPAVNIEMNIHPAFQLRRYAWSAKLPLSILTDFEEFAVYDCRVKPDKGDKASTGRVKLLSYKDYIEKWDEIAAVFSREAVLKGSFDEYAEAIKGRKGTTEVDDAFLAEIERWRELLARNIALRNPNLSVRELNYAVQMTIDRIVFLRICEDRGVERDEQLKEIADPAPSLPPPNTTIKSLDADSKSSLSDLSPSLHFGDAARGNVSRAAGRRGSGSVYSALVQLFQRADARYNSGLFHFRNEKEQSSAADTLTPGLKIDDKVLQDILRNLYYPESPYVFKEIPSDILGQVYERFLGKVIRLTAGHQAKVEEKPEVRKAGGVYYTPTYIVEYIVQNTVGRLLEGKTPKEAAKLKILDPACGSGTFPLGAYQYLLDWHLKWYTDNEPNKWLTGRNPVIYQSKDGYQLTTAKKKEILLNNIFGVDIDAQAVEVTKLSLLLKVLEGENQQTIGSQLSLLQERVLPDLGKNIQCGNSLIGPDYYEGAQLTMGFADDEERYRVNAFDWKGAFPQVFTRSEGGCDAVIGNPPYIRIQTLQEASPIDVDFFKKKYKAASKGNYDIYVVFVEKGLGLLNQKGRLGFILPHKFFNAQYGEPLRRVIAEGKHLAKVVHFGDQQVFEDATTYTCLMFLDKTAHEEFEFERVRNLESWRTSEISIKGEIDSANVTEKEWNFSVGEGSKLIEKLSKMPERLEDIAKRIFQGLKTGADPVFILEERQNGTYYSNALKREVSIENTFLRPLYKSGEMKRYTLRKNSRYVIFPYQNGKLIGWNEITSKAPKTAEYLKACKETLAKRENGRWAGNQWYCYSRNQALEIISSPKILTADLNPFANYCYDERGEACFPGGAAGGYGIVLDKNRYLYILGLLNSKTVDYYHKSISTNFRGGWFGYDAKIIRNIPIRKINFSDIDDVRLHDELVRLVKRMLELTPQLQKAELGGRKAPRTPQEQEMVKREIESTDRQIDRLVYALYGLTEEEIKIVEGG
jgi:type I restriction-modification system DNA methylase subunit